MTLVAVIQTTDHGEPMTRVLPRGSNEKGMHSRPTGDMIRAHGPSIGAFVMRTLGSCREAALVVCLLAVASAASPQTTTPTVAEAERLLKQATDFESAGKFRDGIPVAEHAASLLETSLGPGDLRVANASMVVGTLQFRSGNYSAAATAFAGAGDPRKVARC